jgi:hypothetical protein
MIMMQAFLSVADSPDGNSIQPPDLHRGLFLLVYILCVAWVVGFAVFSGFSRRREGRPIFRPKFPNARFSERWRSGRTLTGSLLGSARSSLWVAVSDGELWVCPHFPFNLIMLKRFGLEHRVPGIDILSVEHPPVASGGGSVIIRYRGAAGKEEAFEITVRDLPGFDRAISEIRNEHVST